MTSRFWIPPPQVCEQGPHSRKVHSAPPTPLIALIDCLEPEVGWGAKYVYFTLGRGESPTDSTWMVRGSGKGAKLRRRSSGAEEPLYLSSAPRKGMSVSKVVSL